MTRIFNHRQPMPLRNLEHCIQIRRMPGIVDGKNRLGLRSNFGLHLLWIQIQRVARNIGKHRACALVQHAIRSRAKRHRRGNGLVPPPQSSGKRGAVQRRRSRIKTNREPRPHKGRKSLFKLSHLRTSRQPIRPQHFRHRRNVVFANRLSAIRQQSLANRRAPMNCEYFVHRNFQNLSHKTCILSF